MNSLVVATLGLKRAMRKVDGVDVSDFFFWRIKKLPARWWG